MAKISAQNSAKSKPKRKAQPRGKPLEKGNPYRFPKGMSGNPGGRPKGVSEAYRAWLAEIDPRTGMSNAQRLAMAMGKKAAAGNVAAAREIRSATEGERVRTWRDDVIELLRARTITPEQVKVELGDELAAELIASAGLLGNEGRETASDGAASAKS